MSSSNLETLTAAVSRSSLTVDEVVVALEFLGDRLDQRIVLVVALDLLTDLLDKLEELVGLHLGVTREQDVGEDVVVALVEFVEVHGANLHPGRTGGRRARSGEYRSGP